MMFKAVEELEKGNELDSREVKARLWAEVGQGGGFQTYWATSLKFGMLEEKQLIRARLINQLNSVQACVPNSPTR